MNYDQIWIAINAEIKLSNAKHGHGELATDIQVVSILCEELGEYAQAIMQKRKQDAEKELIQLVAVAVNHLRGTGPHFSSR